MKKLLVATVGLTIVAAGYALMAQTKAAKPIHIDVVQEKAGGEPTHFIPIVGYWVVAAEGTKNVLMVDGRQWKKGEPSAGLADKARAIYGSRHEEFIDNVKAWAYFPIAVAQGIDDFQNGEISMRFQMVDGALDRCSGILFNVKPNGDYLTVRFNGTEDNLVLWTFNKGVRKFVKKGTEDMPLKMKEWYSMKISVQGTKLEGYLNGKKLLEYTLPEPVSGKVGVWSKTDSVSYFDDYTVTPAP
jgi:hypothetical protein